MKQSLLLKSSAHDVPKDYAFNGIDLFKFVCALLICCIHIDPFQTTRFGLDHYNFYLQHFLCRTAVPFFFISSGFLFFRKTDLHDISTDRIKTYSLRMIRLLGLWILLLFQGGDGHLWYLHAVVVSVVLVAVLLKKGMNPGAVTAVAFVLFVIGLFGDAYNGFLKPLLDHTLPKLLIVAFDNVIPNTRNGLFFGFVFVAMGALFAHKRIVMPNIVAIIGLFASLALMLFEVIWLRKTVDPSDYNLLLSQLPVAFFALYIALHLNLKNKPVYKKLRVLGLLLYLAHLFVDHFVWVGLTLIQKVSGLNVMSLELPLTVAVTLVLGSVIYKLSETEKGRWLKYLYS